MSALLWSCIWNWYIQSLIIALCAVLVLRHRNRIGYSTSIFRNHNLESFRILAWLPIFLQCIMLAHQAALYIKLSTSIEVINNNRKPYWLNESKYLWNVLMCPFVLHAVNSIVATHWHMLIIGSSQLIVLLTPLNLCLIILKKQNLFSDTWFPILQFMLNLKLQWLCSCWWQAWQQCVWGKPVAVAVWTWQASPGRSVMWGDWWEEGGCSAGA